MGPYSGGKSKIGTGAMWRLIAATEGWRDYAVSRQDLATGKKYLEVMMRIQLRADGRVWLGAGYALLGLRYPMLGCYRKNPGLRSHY